MPALFDPPSEAPMGKHALVVGCEQGSLEWFSVRLGKPTASRFNDIITNKGEPTKGEKRQRYINEIIGERISGTIQMHHTTDAMERGKALEAPARGWYEMACGCDVRQVGFVLHDSRAYGCSPDGLVGDDGMVEIKCPLRPTFIKHLRGKKAVPTEYIVQIQSQLWIAERAWCDWCMYSEDAKLRPVTARVTADLDFHAALEFELAKFIAEVAEAEAIVRERMGA